MWMTPCTGSVRGGFWEIWKKSVSRELDTEREGSTFGAPRRQTNLRATGIARDTWGGRWKSQNKKNVYLSLYVKEPLNSKVIKGFVPELRSRKCFSCFEIPIFYVYMLWTFYVRFTYPYHEYVTLRSARLLWRLLENWGDLLSLRLQWKTTHWHWSEKLTRSEIIIIICYPASIKNAFNGPMRWHDLKS